MFALIDAVVRSILRSSSIRWGVGSAMAASLPHSRRGKPATSGTYQLSMMTSATTPMVRSRLHADATPTDQDGEDSLVRSLPSHIRPKFGGCYFCRQKTVEAWWRGGEGTGHGGRSGAAELDALEDLPGLGRVPGRGAGKHRLVGSSSDEQRGHPPDGVVAGPAGTVSAPAERRRSHRLAVTQAASHNVPIVQPPNTSVGQCTPR